MRIGLDATVLDPSTRYTGMGEYTTRLIEHLGRLNTAHTFTVYAPPGSAPPPDLGAAMRWRPLPRLPAGKLAGLVAGLLVLPALARRDRLDLLHVPTVHTRPSKPPLPRALGRPLVVTLHDLIPITYYEATGAGMPGRSRRFYRWNLRAVQGADGLITVSETSRDDIVRVLSVPPERVQVIYHGIDFDGTPRPDDAATRRQLAIRGPYLLFGGSWEPRKNLRRLLDAFDLAIASGLDRDLVMIVERSSGHAPPLRAHAETLACRDRLRFLHDLAPDTLAAVYRGADMFVFPSLSEGFGFPPLQAMACGVPVVASAIPALREVLGDAAMYVDPYDTRAIAEALLALARDSDLRDRLAAGGPARAGRFRWEDAARSTLAVYQAVAGRRD